MGKPLRQLHQLVRKALETTAPHWPAVRYTQRWLHAAAAILANPHNQPGAIVRARFERLTAAWRLHRDKAGPLAKGVDHFLKVTASYWPGLFPCYDVPGLPRTNNDLEHLFGSHRFHERRATGRKVASPSLVLRGSVRIVAAAITRLLFIDGQFLGQADISQWRTLRASIETRRQARAQRARFRKNPQAYLSRLETLACQPSLPS